MKKAKLMLITTWLEGVMMKRALLTVAVVSLLCAVSAQGSMTLLHRYSFTSDATDSVGSADGTLVGAASVTGGKLDLTNSGSYMSTPGIKASVEVQRNLTVEAWVTDASPDHVDKVFSWGIDGNNEFTLYARHDDAAGGNALAVLNTAGANADNNAGAQVTGSKHVVLVVDIANDEKRYYVDGVWQSTGALNGRGVDNVTHTGANYILGASTDGSRQLQCKVEEYRIWDGAMTDAVVSNSYNRGPGQATADADPTLLHRYSFASDATDSVGSADGTLNGSASVTGGKLDTLSGGYMSTAGIKSSVEVRRNLTVEAWVTDATPDDMDRVWSWGVAAGDNEFTVYARHDGATGGKALAVLNTPSGNAANNVGTQSVSGTQHVVLVVDTANNQKRYYVDGALVSSVSLNGKGVDNITHTHTSAVYFLGARYDTTYQLAGKYDEYRVWDGAMTDARVADSYDWGPGLIEAPPKGTVIIIK